MHPVSWFCLLTEVLKGVSFPVIIYTAGLQGIPSNLEGLAKVISHRKYDSEGHQRF